ncbi:helix-turn-helix transcriptional regulator [Actinacidiphila glaucinigra]|uniref:helix-turn-helix domain-containing protein n=1 Tax=Actinacidiphila glaucinigra TaxID=235986 RepID=UPI0033B6B9C3
MSESPPAKELPAGLLSDPAMITACRTRDFATIFRLVKIKAGIYPSMVARRCDLTPSRVGEVMSGRRKLVHIDVIERVADGLHIPGHMLGLARRAWESPARPQPTGQAAVSTAPDPDSERQPPSALPGAEVDGILALAAGASPSASTLQALRSSIEDYWRRDDEHGGEALRPAVVGQLRYVIELLKEGRPTALQNDLYAVAAELARLTGWTHFDARQYHQARTYFTEALRLAKPIDDHPFMANVLACMSLQATYQDKPGDALALVTAAQDQARAGQATTPRVLSMLAMREAFAQATLGNRAATHAAISQAHAYFGRIQPGDLDPAWVAYFDEPKLIADTGIAHGRLGETALAEPLIADALNREPHTNHRGRAFHTFWLARTQLQRGKIDQACHTATSALAPAASITSERVRGHLTEFYEQLAPHRQTPAAVVFEARLRETLPTAINEARHP